MRHALPRHQPPTDPARAAAPATQPPPAPPAATAPPPAPPPTHQTPATRTPAPGCPPPPPEPPRLRRRQAGQPRMRDHHALGRPGRPRRIDHIRRMIGRAAAAPATRPGLTQRRLTRPATAPGHPAPPAPAPRPAGRSRRHRRRRHHHRRARIGQHERDPLRRVPRIHRQVRRPRLRHRQHRGHQAAERLHRHRHHPLRPRTPPGQHPASRPAAASSAR